MYTGLKHLHLLMVVLFLISVLVKTILLIIKSDKFDTYRNKTKVPEMIVTMLFLVTGITMLVQKGGQVHHLFWIKIGLVVVAIPLAIVGFKKKSVIPAILGTFVFIMCYGLAEMASKKAVINEVEVAAEKEGSIEHGKQYFEANCVACHGIDGKLGLGGASDLTASSLDEKQAAEVLKNGKGNMPAFSHLSENEVKAVVSYLQSLKQ